MLALISFPFLVEPKLTSRQQAYTWSAAYVLFAAMCAFAAWSSREGKQIEDGAGSTTFRRGRESGN